ncbi:MAG: DNA-binding protein [Betaproteobacteria bacterium]|nr:DNA-binding protein [Betaproteobacteria bacterium]
MVRTIGLPVRSTRQGRPSLAWLSVKDAAELRGVSVQAIYQAVKRGQLKARLAKGEGRTIEVHINTEGSTNVE